jgi:hypothetical protein
MWTQIFDEDGKSKRKDGTPYSYAEFRDALRRPHRVTSKVEMLTEKLVDGKIVLDEVEGGTIFSADKTNELTNFITDGYVDVDTTRAIRRTAELTLLNPTAEFTPATGDFDPEGPWVGKVYLNRLVRIWRGLYIGDQARYVPIGTMMVDIADVLVEQNMSLVNLTMSDRFKKMMKSYVGHQKMWDKGTHYNTIIKDILTDCGIPLLGKYAAQVDDLLDRDPDDRKTNIKFKLEQGDSRGEKLKEFCDRWDIDIYFDPMGILRTEDRRSDRDRQPVFKYWSGGLDVEGRHGMMISMKRSFNDDNLYNHVIIVGTGGQGDGDPNTPNVVRAQRRDDNPYSKTSIDRIGDRVYLFETDKISRQNEADRALNRAWKLRFQLSESIEVTAINNPMLEGDDMVTIEERNFAKVEGNYRLQRFNVPLVTSRQTLQAVNIIRDVA